MQPLTQSFPPKHNFGDKIRTDGLENWVWAELQRKYGNKGGLALWIDWYLPLGTRRFPHAGCAIIPMWKDARFARRIGPKIGILDSAGKSGQN